MHDYATREPCWQYIDHGEWELKFLEYEDWAIVYALDAERARARYPKECRILKLGSGGLVVPGLNNM
jgi:hypothetical protein